jgi:drug/metabolite transporter (DMT)-like permease
VLSGPELAILLGLASGVSWGLADFCGGLSSRRMNAAAVAAVSQIIGTAAVAVLIPILQPRLPPWDALALGLLAGVAGGLGVWAFYRALSVGTMSLVAPISALGAAVPIAVGLLRGETPGALALAGAFVALAGAGLASRAPGPVSREGIGMAVVAAVAFGLFFVLIDPAADVSVLWAGLSTRIASVPILVALSIGLRASFRVPGGLWLLIIAAGLLDIAANLAYAWGIQEGDISIVAVLAGLYPVATVILAQLVLKERLSRGQATGIGLALLGVGLIAAGS